MFWHTQAKAALSLAQKMNPMESALKLNDRVDEGLLAARSQILDTNLAEDTAKSAQAYIVEQASISVWAQAMIRRCRWDCCALTFSDVLNVGYF